MKNMITKYRYNLMRATNTMFPITLGSICDEKSCITLSITFVIDYFYNRIIFTRNVMIKPIHNDYECLRLDSRWKFVVLLWIYRHHILDVHTLVNYCDSSWSYQHYHSSNLNLKIFKILFRIFFLSSLLNFYILYFHFTTASVFYQYALW